MKGAINSSNTIGAMAELVDASVLGTDFLGSVGSSPIRPTKDDYDTVYDISYSSTIGKMKGVVNNKKGNFGSLSNQYFRM